MICRKFIIMTGMKYMFFGCKALTSLDLSGLRLVMIKPSCGVSTKEAYAGIKPKGTSELFKDLNVLNDFKVLTNLTNDFEETVCRIHPEIAEIKMRLQEAGAIYAAMSGSGSTVFGLFTTPHHTTLHHAAQHNAEGSADAQLRLLHEEFASMVIFDDTLA